MKFKIDENLPLALAHHLRLIGHEADTVSDENLAGAPDSLVVAAALREQRVVLTLDKKGMPTSASTLPVHTRASFCFAPGRPTARTSCVLIRRVWMNFWRTNSVVA